ncbi:MAG TPA: hypothetical protein VM865_01135 [Acidobacteriaceae bacterium]|jgi:hypothetical protein|nr:hypothetical protein [Acidobacteriaceae bacterium]
MWWRVAVCAVVAAVAALGTGFAYGQGETTFTLHAYANVVQIPALVLNSDHDPHGPVDPERLRVSLDGGKLFAPAHVRLEGEDPIELAIVLDLSGSQRTLEKSFSEAVVDLAPGFLHPQDRVSIYGLNCTLWRSADGIVPEQDRLREAVTAAWLFPPEKERRGHPCGGGRGVGLWDSASAVVRTLAERPGRRVLLVISDGQDRGSVASWKGLYDVAARSGVAVFGLVATDTLSLSRPNDWASSAEFRNACQGTGGVVFQAPAHRAAERMRQLVSLLRKRYILEFPAPRKMQAGTHSVSVTLLRDPNAVVEVAGVTVLMQDERQRDDPTTVPSAAGTDIPVGERRPQLE